ncbi:hypothetical protein F2Q69_00043968 [Brassica cretica]|uniref:Uncharacterized protein n=1 Tax=Brassica cretica TaxID=69181 RepID=A0A8S9NH95_BRACR|nr:hypothetical protein F2Q69_00043968 [Brassica cretica]
MAPWLNLRNLTGSSVRVRALQVSAPLDSRTNPSQVGETCSVPDPGRRQAQRIWASVTVAGRCNGEAQSARGSSEVTHLVWVSWGSAQLIWNECSGLGPVGQVWTVTEPVGWPRMAMDRWALLVRPWAWAIHVGFSLTCLGVDEQAQDVWEEKGWPNSTSYGQDSLKGRDVWEGSFMGVGNDPVMVFDHG